MSSVIKNKLYDLEQTPPTSVWNKIAAELDASALDHSFPSKLYEAEVTAPAGAWNKIAAQIDNGIQETVIPKKTIPWLRYAAAAVLIGLIAWGGFQLLQGKKTNNDIAREDTRIHQDPPPIINNDPAPVTNDLPSETEIVRIDEERNDRALEESKRTFAKLDLPRTSNKLRDIASAFSFASNELSPPDEIDFANNNENINNRYIVLMTPDGNFVRMSKKLGDMVCCVSGEEMDKKCVDQMSLWKQQLACSPTGHSAGNFLDLINLLKSLED